MLLIVLATLGHGSVAQAHDSRPAYLELNETASGRYEVLWRTPINAGMRLPVVLKFPHDTRNITAPSEKEFTGMLLERRWIETGKTGLAGKRIEFVGLQATITDVLVRVQRLDGAHTTTLVHPSQPWIEIPASAAYTGDESTASRLRQFADQSGASYSPLLPDHSARLSVGNRLDALPGVTSIGARADQTAGNRPWKVPEGASLTNKATASSDLCSLTR
ncbi:hypothetical protein [Bradyrhizobium cytisi]|uniref:Uncharacterized protein n=1 Tax=Bradyrhizobium cytisi TaxID=515489 RepID=A0A5S4WZE6_9BRAD|nr:hypothetical protein [Bradyrhizobium cytisi]TYL87039.1 hypothetical protein FXB38_05370 [Bradyrhizobium cytisi]